MSHFWMRLCQRIGTGPKLSTARHPETDEQTENANTSLKKYLMAYINHEQDDWALLSMAELAATAAVNSTGTSASLAIKEIEPRYRLELTQSVRKQLQAPAQRN
jgi:hypothetical protein